MNKRLYLLMSILLINCNNHSPEILWKNAELMRSEKNLKECIINLESIVNKYPKHDLAAKALFQKAEIYLNDVKDYDFAVEEFQKVVDQFPDHEVSKKSLFMIAYIFNNYLNAYSDAIIIYQLFREKYPNDELIPSVEFELDGLKDIQSTIDSLNSIINKKSNI